MNAAFDISEYDRLRANCPLHIDMSREQFDALAPRDREALRACDDTDELLDAHGDTLYPWVVNHRAAGTEALADIIATWIGAWVVDAVTGCDGGAPPERAAAAGPSLASLGPNPAQRYAVNEKATHL